MPPVDALSRDTRWLVGALVLSGLAHAALLWARLDGLLPTPVAPAPRPLTTAVEPAVPATVHLSPHQEPPPPRMLVDELGRRDMLLRDTPPRDAAERLASKLAPVRLPPKRRGKARVAPATLAAAATADAATASTGSPPGLDGSSGGSPAAGDEGGADPGSGGPGSDDDPSPGIRRDQLLRGYLAEAEARVRSGHPTYPPLARRSGLEGVVEILLVLAPDGSLAKLLVAASSDVDVLDEAAVAYVASLAPFPPFPDGLPREPLPLRVPVVYRLR